MSHDELRKSLAFLPGRANPRVWVTKPSKGCIKKFIGGRSIPTGALSVKGPTKNKFCGAIAVRSHPTEPMVYQRRFPDTTPGNNCDDICLRICPGSIQKSDVLLSTENIFCS